MPINYETSNILFADGTAALPSITNIGDTNTGIAFTAADQIVISTGGTAAMTIDSSQVVTFAADPVFGGATPSITIGDGGEEDTTLLYNGAAVDYYFGIQDAADTLQIGVGSTPGTTTAITITSALAVTGGSTAITDAYAIRVADGKSAFTDNAAATTAALALKNATATQTSVLALSVASDDGANGVDADSVYINFILDDDAQTQTVYGALHCVAADTANASDDGAFTLNLIAAGVAAAERFRVASNGDLTMTTDANTTPTSWALKTLSGIYVDDSTTTVEGSVPLPANALIIGVNTEVTTIFAGNGVSQMDYGITGTLTAWGSNIGVADGDKSGPDNYTVTAPIYVGAAQDFVVTMDNAATSGEGSYTIYYIDLPDIGV